MSSRKRRQAGGVYFSKGGNYRDSNWPRIQLRAREFMERQLVSLLDIKGLGWGGIRGLRDVGITTVEALMNADPEELLQKLRQCKSLPCRHDRALEWIRTWQDDARVMWKEKEEALRRQDEVDRD
jgi:hypothetical protein